MTNYIKDYIGKGKTVQINGLETEIVQVTLKLAQAEAFVYEKEGVKYLSFQVAKMKSADEYGRTHTCYVNSKAKQETTEPLEVKEPAPKKDKRVKKA